MSLVVVSLVSGCGSSSKAAGRPSTTTSAPEATTSTVAASGVGTAAAANLRLRDFPDGWTSTDAAAQNVPAWRTLAACLAVPPSTFYDPATTSLSPDFSDPTGFQTIGGTVDVAAAVDEARSELATAEGDRVPGCLGEVIKAQARGAAAVTVVSGARTAFPAMGDETVAYRVKVSFRAAGKTSEGVEDLVFVRKGRAVVTLRVDSSDGDPALEDERPLLQAVLDRLTGVA